MGELLAPYLSDPGTLFIISSDFCHWGSRFNYQWQQQSHVSHGTPFLVSQAALAWLRQAQRAAAHAGACACACACACARACARACACACACACWRALQLPQRPLRAPAVPTLQGPIWKSIEWLDDLAMRTIEQVGGHAHH
jgi:predicted class III extradiol MEMO1 family dioxygenase